VKTGIDNFDQLKEVLCFFQFFSAPAKDWWSSHYLQKRVGYEILVNMD